MIKYPFTVVVSYQASGSNPPRAQNYSAENIRQAVKIMDREQGKPNVKAVRLTQEIYEWHKTDSVER